MALMNRRLNGKIETVFMMPAEQYTYISSRLIKEVFSLGGRVHGLVPDMVEERLREKVPAAQARSETARRDKPHDALADRTAPHCQLADDEGDGDGRSPAPRRRRGHRLRRRRAGLRDAGADQRRRARGDRSAISRSTRRSAASRSCKRAICDRYRLDYGVEYTEIGGHRQRRRQAGAVQHGAGAVRPGRRGHHARAVLADADRAGEAGRRDAGARATRRRRTASRSRRGAILDAITPRTRGIIINSPCNPTGALISEDELTIDRAGGGAPRHLGRRRSLLREADLRCRRRTICRRVLAEALPRSRR